MILHDGFGGQLSGPKSPIPGRGTRWNEVQVRPGGGAIRCDRVGRLHSQQGGATAQTYVFATETGTAVDPRNALRAISSAAKGSGMPGVGLHTLRNSAATALLEAGVPLRTVSKLLGHSSVAVTGDVYGHVSTEGARSAVERLSVAMGW